MTLSPWIIYLWGIADSVRTAFDNISFAMGFFVAIGLIAAVITACVPDDEDAKKAHRVLRRVLWWVCPVWFLSLLGYTFTPSQKTIAMMVVVPAIINSEPIQKDLPEIYQMAKDALKQTLQPSK